MVFTESRAELFLDGKRVSDARMDKLPSFFATAGQQDSDGTIIVKATNYSAQARETELDLVGTDVLKGVGRHIVYQAASLGDDNSLENPTKLVPSERTFPVTGSRIKVMLPPFSVSVLRVPARSNRVRQ